MKNTYSFLFALSLLFVAEGAPGSTIVQDFRPMQPRNLPEALSVHEDTPVQALEKKLKRSLKQRPEDAATWHQLGTVLYRQRHVREARGAWKKAHDLDTLYAPPVLMADVQNIFTLAENGKSEEAKTALSTAAEIHSQSPYFHLVRAEQAMRSRAFETAEEAYGKAVEVAPNFFAAKLNLGRYLEFSGRHDEARDAYEKATIDAPDHPMTWDFLGSHQFSAGEIDLARESFLKAEKSGLAQPLAEVRLADLFLEAGDNIGARYWYLKALDRVGHEREAILVALGNVQMRLNQLKEAAQTLDEVLATTQPAPVLVARGYLAEKSGDYQTAAEYYREAVKAEPGNVVASNNLAMVLVRLGANPEEALSHSRHALKFGINNAFISGTYAVALAHSGNSEDALKALKRNVRINPDDPWVRYFLGRILLAQSATEEAMLHLEAVQILDPNFERLDEVQTMISLIRR